MVCNKFDITFAEKKVSFFLALLSNLYYESNEKKLFIFAENMNGR
jgi:hypothetical protein